MKKIGWLFIFYILWMGTAWSEDFMDMSLDELLDIKIESVSKKKESRFDAPLSATVLTRREIMNSGAASIPDALRLVPGLIVREQSPGNFDIHLRGFDNIPPYARFSQATNLITLVMIDSRPVYDFYQGGTLWESLPVGLVDVEKIEVIRGPSAALYGPNAVAGVINIITRRPAKKGVYFSSKTAGGTHNNYLNDISAGYNYDDKFSLLLSAHQQKKDRQETKYYETAGDRYVEHPEDLMDSRGRFFDLEAQMHPDPELAMDQESVNTFFLMTPTLDFSADISAGFQNARVQKIYTDTSVTSFTTHDVESSYLNMKIKIKDFSIHASYLNGEKETIGIGEEGFYDFNTYDIMAEYAFTGNQLSLRPGFSFRKAVYDGEIIAGKQTIDTYALSFLGEYKLSAKWRWITALRVDQYSDPDDLYLSWQMGSTYKFTPENLIRFVYSRANRSPGMIDTFMNLSISAPGMSIKVLGNDSLELLTMDMFEIGYKQKLFNSLNLDLELFFQQIQDYQGSSQGQPFMDFNTGLLTMTSQYQNLDLKAKQYGATLAFDFIPIKTMSARLFGTLQYTELTDYADLQKLLQDGKHTATPLFYGGFDFNYQPTVKVNCNANAYYYSKQTFRHTQETFDLDDKFILNTKIAYYFHPDAAVYANIRNLLNDKAQEFAWADQIGRTFLFGLQIDY